MNGIYKRLIRISITYAVVGYLVFVGLSAVSWQLFPERHSGDELTQQIRWTVHVVA
jgi:hypothetical protein